ncbi:MAG: STT3 domain-containing protein [Methanobacteriota archaeon]
MKKNWWVAATLISIFFLVLLLNTYFNVASGFAVNPDGVTLTEKFYLSGPDPYYNMRLVENTVETGRYPFYTTDDPLLAYPIGKSGGRGPMLNMVAIGFSKLLIPFMNPIDALGYSMQFVPALFGALLIFPVYFIGETLFGKKAGIIAALLIALIPIHIGSGHGSAFALFDHDSFNLLLFFLTFLFLIKGIKENNTIRSIFYGVLGGISLAALTMVWVEAEFLYVVITIYAVVQMMIDMFTKKVELRVPITLTTLLFTGFLLYLPIRLTKGFAPSLFLYTALVILIFGLYYLFTKRQKLPWVISLSVIVFIGIIGFVFLYFVGSLATQFPFLAPLEDIANIIYGSGIYGAKVSETIAEAGTYSMSRSVMSFGPALYWLAWIGFGLLVYYYAVKEKLRRDYLFFIVLFLIEAWLAGTAGRFLNDSVPLVAILGGWVIWIVIDKIQLKQMWRNIRNAGGGFHGLRKGIKIYHVLGVLLITILVVLPNALLALDAGIPSTPVDNGTINMKTKYFGENFTSAFGSGMYKEQYWVGAFSWLNNQDTEISDPAKRPAFISWWDYGFYAAAVSGHPTVADNFQDGIPTAANFHTSTSEKAAVAVWIVRCLEGNRRDNNGVLSQNVVAALEKHLGKNDTVNITGWIENPETAPSYNAPIGEQYDEALSERYRVGEQWPENGYYHDIVSLIDTSLDDEAVTWLYHDIQNTTGYSIRYYGVEGYDRDIFNIFGFLSDKSIILPALRTRAVAFSNPEDEFVKIVYTGYNINPDGTVGSEAQWTSEQLNAMTAVQRRYIQIQGTGQQYKNEYFNTTFYRVYMGTPPQQDSQGNIQYPTYQLPTYLMRHFSVKYLSPLPYLQGQSAVVIAKYYEGAYINGSLQCNNTPLPYVQVAVLDEYGIPHDGFYTGYDGNYSVLVPGGNITLQFTYENQVLIKEIRFNSTDTPIYAPITEDEAMRKTDYTRILNVAVNFSTVEGYVYEDNNNNGSYEPTIDTPLRGITLEVTDQYNQYFGFGRDLVPPVVTDQNGSYQFTRLYPSVYMIVASEDGFELHSETIPVSPDHQFFNISKPKLSGVQGAVYFDSNKDGAYTAGEQMSGVNVKLIYAKNNRLVNSITTTGTGAYNFPSLIPGAYLLNATVINTQTGHLDYLKEESITLEANKTLSLNISMDYAPITVSGLTTSDAKPISNIPITFYPDRRVINNTAQQGTATTDTNGSYTVNLKPGSYNVTILTSYVTGSYSFGGNLALTMGEGIKTYNIPLTKLSATVTGKTTYNGVPVANLTIDFAIDTTVENNTAQEQFLQADSQGIYTVDLVPGTYNVDIYQIVQENGQNVTYYTTDTLLITSSDIPIGRTYNIALTRA